MEETILRFPLIAEQIFDQMDDQNLTKCRGISKTWFGVTERLQWTRKIKGFSGVLLRRQLMKRQLSRQMFVRKLLFLVCCFFSVI